MITDQLKNINQYLGLSKNIDTAIEFINSNDLNELEFGKHVINDDIFLIKSDYQTKAKSDALYEAHKKYIDLQVILEGEELIYGEDINNLQEVIPYNQDKEAAFYNGDHSWEIIFKKGTFALFYFADAHMPGVTKSEVSKITKIVFKIND